MAAEKTLVVAYQGCILFEVMLAAQLLHASMPVDVATPTTDDVRDPSGLTVTSGMTYAEMDPTAYGCVLVPGGNPDEVAENDDLLGGLRAAHESGAVVGGVCAGVVVLGLSGLLATRRVAHNYTADDVPPEIRAHTDRLWTDTTYEPAGWAVDGRVVTARPERFVEFAAAVALATGRVDERGASRIVSQYRPGS